MPGSTAPDARGADRAGTAYWDALWAETSLPQPLDPELPGLDNYPHRRFHDLLRQALAPLEPLAGKAFLEVGCAHSVWLPHIARTLGMDVTGIDYSDLGCRQTEALLERAGVRGRVVCADVFSPPSDLLGAFDAVLSIGVVEHFEDTTGAVGALAAFLRPGGIIVTEIPNLAPPLGTLLRALNHRVYEAHLRVTFDDLRRAHEGAGLEVVSARYFMSTSFGVVVNLSGLDEDAWQTRLKAAAGRVLRGFSKVVWAVEQRLGPLPETRILAPYVVCVARRPEGQG